LSDKDKEIIDKVAEKIVNSDMQGFAIFLLQTLKPVYFLGGELATFFLAPYLTLLDERGFEFIDTFQKRENIDILLNRIEELEKSKDKKNEQLLTDTKKGNFSLKEKISKFLK